MSKPNVLASSVGKSQPHSVTFEVSDHFLEQAREGQWSEPVRFRFEQREAGRWDLVMQTQESRYGT